MANQLFSQSTHKIFSGFFIHSSLSKLKKNGKEFLIRTNTRFAKIANAFTNSKFLSNFLQVWRGLNMCKNTKSTWNDASLVLFIFILFFLTLFGTHNAEAKNHKIKNNKKHTITKTKHSITKSFPIDNSYILQISLNNNKDCKNTIGTNCLFNDSILAEPYFHATKLVIFFDKIYALQTLKTGFVTLPIQNGFFKFFTDNGNSISFETSYGNVTNLKLLKGNLQSEENNISNCTKSLHFYQFYQAYDKNNEIFITTSRFKDLYNFEGINEISIFANKNNQEDLMMVVTKPDGAMESSPNANFCRAPKKQTLLVKYASEEDCATNKSAADQCFQYENCEDVITIENCQVKLFKDGF